MGVDLEVDVAQYGYVLQTGRIVLAGTAEELEQNAIVREYYLGLNETKEAKNYAQRKSYRIEKRWR